MLVFTREASRAVDRAAIEEFGLPGIVLMENAARAVCAEALRLRGRTGRAGSFLIVCGAGNNGGDGFAAARHLHNDGLPVQVALLAARNRIAGDARINLNVVEKMGLTLFDCGADPAAVLDQVATAAGGPSVIVDAIVGTGLDRPLEGPAKGAVEWINRAAAGDRSDRPRVLAVDIPSGLECDTGKPLGDACVRADATVTFCGPKAGFAAPGAAAWLGRVVVGDIGAPRALLARFGTPPAGAIGC